MSYPLWRLRAGSALLPDQTAAADVFGPLDRLTLERLLKAALQNGGEFAEIYAEHSVRNSFILDEERISAARCGVDTGLGIRVLNAARTGYAYSENLDVEELEKTAHAASLIGRGAGGRNVSALRKKSFSSHYLVRTSPESIASKEKAALLRNANSMARSYDRRIKQVKIVYEEHIKKILIANTEGVLANDNSTQTNLGLFVSASDNGKTSSGYAFKSGALGYEHYDMKTVARLVNEAGRMAVSMLEAKDAPAGEYPVVMAKEHCGLFFHEAIGHSLEGDYALTRTSCFWDKKGSRIASEIVSLADQGVLPGSRGTINMDDEGTAGQRTILIDKGECRGFLFDRLNAELMKAASTGNGRRESFRFFPIPRMTNTYLMPGEDDPQDIVKSVSHGIYISRIIGGNVSPTTGNFVFIAPEAYLIESGKITSPLRSIQLIGRGTEVLKKITMIGPDLGSMDGGDCGKDDQSVPVSCGNPTFKVADITVGGARI